MQPLTDRQWLEMESTGELSDKAPVRFLGWIPGDRQDKSILVDLGVVGPMVFRRHDNLNNTHEKSRAKDGIFEKCEISIETALRLMKDYPAFIPGTFTGIDANGKQTLEQPLYRM